MPEFLGPPKPGAQYTADNERPIGAFGGSPTYTQPVPKWMRDLVLMIYAGKPVASNFTNVHSVAEGGGTQRPWDNRLGDQPTEMGNLFGAKLGYRPNKNLEFNLDAWRQNPTIEPSPGTGGRAYNNLLQVLSANIAGRLPTDYGTFFAGAGPAAMWSQQSDRFGASPPALDLGAHLFAGYERELYKNLFGFLEMKGLLGAMKPKDQQGAYRGDYNTAGIVGGIGWKFGGPDEDK